MTMPVGPIFSSHLSQSLRQFNIEFLSNYTAYCCTIYLHFIGQLLRRLIAFVGFKASGKNTAAAALYPFGFVPLSFADALKDALAAIFCWDRHLLEGITDESRIWRETIDTWWASQARHPSFHAALGNDEHGHRGDAPAFSL